MSANQPHASEAATAEFPCPNCGGPTVPPTPGTAERGYYCEVDGTAYERTYADKPGMDPSTGRCLTCDGRYCGTTCDAREGHVWVVGKGWRSPDAADAIAAAGYQVHWGEVWTEADGGHVVPANQ